MILLPRALPLSLLLLTFFTGCVSNPVKKVYEKTEEHIVQGDYTQAVAVLEENKKTYKKKERLLYFLDSGMLHYYAQDDETSNDRLHEAEIAIEELYTKSISREAGSYIANDTVTEYSGEDYEDIYLNIIKCLNYSRLSMPEDAQVELRRVRNKLNILSDKYEEVKIRFHNSALARWLGALFYRWEGSPDDFRIEIEEIGKAFEQEEIYNFSAPPSPQYSPEEGKALIDFVAFTGRGPYKESLGITLTMVPGAVNLAIDDGDAQELLGFTTVPFPSMGSFGIYRIAFPQMKTRESIIDRVVVKIGAIEKELDLIEDMGRVAQETYRGKQGMIITKTVIRAATKIVAKEVGKAGVSSALENEMGAGGALLGLLFGFAGDVAIALSEQADTRLSNYFPGKAYVTEMEVEPGDHNIVVEYYNGSDLIHSDDRGIVTVDSRSFKLFDSYCLK